MGAPKYKRDLYTPFTHTQTAWQWPVEQKKSESFLKITPVCVFVCVCVRAYVYRRLTCLTDDSKKTQNSPKTTRRYSPLRHGMHTVKAIAGWLLRYTDNLIPCASLTCFCCKTCIHACTCEGNRMGKHVSNDAK